MSQPPFWSIARKDVRLIFRDRTALIFIFGLPLVFTVIFGAIFSGRNSDDSKHSPFKVAVTNLDAGTHGAEVIASLQQVGLTIEQAKNLEELKKDVRSGDIPIGVVLPTNFSAQLQTAVDQAVAGREKPDQAKIKVLIDPAQTQIAGMAQGAIFAATQRATLPLYRAAALARVPEAFRSYAAKNMTAGNGAPAVGLDVAELTQAKSGAPEPTPGDRYLPGLIVYFIFFLANGVAVTLISERQEGTLRRMLSAPFPPWHILWGKMLARSYLGLLQVAMIYVVGAFTTHFSFSVNPLSQLLVVLVCIFTATGLGLLIASVGRTQEQIQGMTTLLLLMMGLLSGCLFPRPLLPDLMQKLSYLTPHAWALNAYQDILLRRMPLTATLSNLGVVLLFGAVFYGIALSRFRYE